MVHAPEALRHVMQFSQSLGVPGYPMNSATAIGEAKGRLQRLPMAEAHRTDFRPQDKSPVTQATQQIEPGRAGLDGSKQVEDDNDEGGGKNQWNCRRP